MDEARLNGLLVARGLLDKASTSRDGTAPGDITAIILVDAAVETASKAILGDKVRRGQNFPELINALNQAWRDADDRPAGAELEGAGQVRKLRNYRNGVQHDGNIPSADDVNRYLVYAAGFVDGATQTFVGQPLATLSRAQLLVDGPVRTAVQEAEQLAAAQDYNDAAQHLIVAFEHVMDAARGDQPWRHRPRFSKQKTRKALAGLSGSNGVSSSLKSKLKEILAAGPAKLSTFDRNKLVDAMLDDSGGDTADLEKLLEGLTKEVEWLGEQVELGTAAGDPAEHAWFRGRLGKGWSEWTEQPTYHTVAPEPPITHDEYVRALDFVLRAATRQQRTGQAPAPAWSRRGLEERRQTSSGSE